MKNTSLEVDAYIANSAEFARPILTRIRKLFHKACPQVEEVIKWGTPHFQYKGLLGGMAAFKKHAAFGLWKAKLLPDPHGLFRGVGGGSMCMVKAMTQADLPGDAILLEYFRAAVALNDEEVSLPRPRPKTKPKSEITVPDDVAAALRQNAQAQAVFEAFSPGHRREYIEWITEAKREATREKRLATMIQWLTEGRSRNWKYNQK